MNVAQHTLVFGLRLYQWVLSPMIVAIFGPVGRCRFEPTCSQYALEAVAAHGALRGSWLAVKRLCRCHPWGGSGWDPVPGGRRTEAGGQRTEDGVESREWNVNGRVDVKVANGP